MGRSELVLLLPQIPVLPSALYPGPTPSLAPTTRSLHQLFPPSQPHSFLRLQISAAFTSSGKHSQISYNKHHTAASWQFRTFTLTQGILVTTS
jgi:hypothetical protein